MDDRYDLLSPYLTDARKERFAEVLGQRTNWVTAVTEDLFDPHNISAVLRSCDGFGIQSAHIIEVNNPYRVSPGVAKGAAKWLDIERHTDTTHALRDLKARGFAICCTTPHTDDTTPEELPLDRPVAPGLRLGGPRHHGCGARRSRPLRPHSHVRLHGKLQHLRRRCTDPADHHPAGAGARRPRLAGAR